MKYCLLWCGTFYCLLFETIAIICSLEPLLYFTSLCYCFSWIHLLIVKIVLVWLIFYILIIVYCYWQINLEKKKKTLMLHVLLYVIISSLPNDEVMYLYQNYGLLKLGKYFKRALFVYLRRYIFFTIQINVHFQSSF